MEAKRTIAEIDKEIEETKEALKNVHGTETEVYARIVGYYRAVKHWNKGKRDEFDQRKMFTLEASKEYDITEADGPCECSAPAKMIKAETNEVSDLKSVTYEIYTRATCPNCPPVKEFVSHLEMPGRAIDVDTKEGLDEAGKKGVFASPTVIFYNEAGIETARCHNVEELEAVFSSVTVNA
jgi:ribonucleoside-triphosphate reductase